MGTPHHHHCLICTVVSQRDAPTRSVTATLATKHNDPTSVSCNVPKLDSGDEQHRSERLFSSSILAGFAAAELDGSARLLASGTWDDRENRLQIWLVEGPKVCRYSLSALRALDLDLLLLCHLHSHGHCVCCSGHDTYLLNGIIFESHCSAVLITHSSTTLQRERFAEKATLAPPALLQTVSRKASITGIEVGLPVSPLAVTSRMLQSFELLSRQP